MRSLRQRQRQGGREGGRESKERKRTACPTSAGDSHLHFGQPEADGRTSREQEPCITAAVHLTYPEVSLYRRPRVCLSILDSSCAELQSNLLQSNLLIVQAERFMLNCSVTVSLCSSGRCVSVPPSSNPRQLARREVLRTCYCQFIAARTMWMKSNPRIQLCMLRLCSSGCQPLDTCANMQE